jgi:tryptophanyl-tRNA synthetase
VPKTSAPAEQQIVTPWDVKGQIAEDGRQLAINYDTLIEQFGTRRVDDALLERFEKLTGTKPHPLLRRGMFFSHRYVGIFMTILKISSICRDLSELGRILDTYEKGKPFYLYTGRGPSSDSMHMGHLIPFLFTK